MTIWVWDKDKSEAVRLKDAKEGTVIVCPKCKGRGTIIPNGFTCHCCYGYGNVYLEQYAAEVLSK